MGERTTIRIPSGSQVRNFAATGFYTATSDIVNYLAIPRFKIQRKKRC
jgi:hypothetical protein